MRGPLPAEQRARRNAPTIPTTKLPAGGRRGPVPKPPRHAAPLGEHGTAWWRWAWRTPTAAAWCTSDLSVIHRRARLEDLLHESDGLLLDKMLREMRELDDRLGLTPKSRAQLRWQVVDDSDHPAATSPATVPSGSVRRGLRLVAEGG
jgi:hypothetical protein